MSTEFTPVSNAEGARVPHDHDRDPGSSSGGKRRAPEPTEQPRRRRRSMEGAGGVSVSDLVERHSGSRSNLMPVPAADEPDEVPRHQPPATGRRAAPDPVEHTAPDDPGSRHAAPARSHRAAEEPPGPAPRTGRRRRQADEDQPDPAAHRNEIATGRRAMPPAPHPYDAQPPAPPRPAPVEPPRRPAANTGTHNVPADVLAQSTNQRPPERVAPPAEEAMPRSVLDMLAAGPTPVGKRAKRESFAESAKRGRAEAQAMLPGNNPPPAGPPSRHVPAGEQGPARAPGTPDFPLDGDADYPRNAGRRVPGRRGRPRVDPAPAPDQGRPGQFPANGPEASQPPARPPHGFAGDGQPGQFPANGRPSGEQGPRANNRGQSGEFPVANGRPADRGSGPRPADGRPGPNDNGQSGQFPVANGRPTDGRNQNSGPRPAPGRPVGQFNGTGEHPQPAGPRQNGQPPRQANGRPNGQPGPGEHPDRPIGEQPQSSGHAPHPGPRANGQPPRQPNGRPAGQFADDHPIGEHPQSSGRAPHPGPRPTPRPAAQFTEGDQPQASGHFQRPANRPSGQSGEFPTVARPASQFTDGPIGDQPQASGHFPHPNRDQPRPAPRPAAQFTEGDQPQASGHFQRPANRPSGQSGEFPTVARPAGQFTDGPIGDQPQASGSFPHPNRGQSGQFPAGGAEQPRPTGQFPIPPGEQSAGRGRPPQPGSRSGQFPVAGQENAGDQSGQFRAQPGGQPQANGEGKPHIPRQQAPGQSSMPPRPDEPERAEPPVERIGLTPPPGVSPQELAGLTTEMEPIGEAVQKRRRVDQTLARFSKVHDELKAEEKARKSKRIKLSPWAAEDAELDEKLDELAQLPGTELVTPVAEDEPEKPKRSRWSLIAKVFSGSTALVVFAATAAGWGFKEWTENSIGQVHALDPDSADIKNAQAQLGDENFLLVGSDSREGAQAEDNIGDVSKIPGARSDTVMIAHIPADRSRVVIVSFPRDLEINRPACQRFDAKQVKYLDEQVAANKTAKMNTAYEVGGPLCLTRVVQEISGLHITRFVGIDFQGFKGMVDAVDGVNVCVEKPMYDTTLNKWVVQQAGTDVVLRGEQALDFVRARHVRGDPTSDYGRIKRQQRFLSSLLRKAMSGQVLLDPSKLTNFVSEMAKSTFGDNIQIDALMQLGQSLQNLAAGRVTFVTVPTVGIENSRHNEVLRRDDSNALFAAIINDQPLPGESAGAPTEGNQQAAPIRPQPEPVDPKTLKIQVLNGGNPTGGIAKRTADKLAEFGFTVVQSGIGPAVPKTVVRYGAGHEAAAQTLASAVPGAELQEDPSMSGALVLTIGPDFAGQVIAPGTGGANPNPTPPPAPLPENLSTVNGADVNCA